MLRFGGKMKLMRSLLVWKISEALFAVLSIAVSLASTGCEGTGVAEAPNAPQAVPVHVEWVPTDANDSRLCSILRLSDRVFCTTSDGFYRANLADHRWFRAAGMPMIPGGIFAQEPADSRVLYYSTYSYAFHRAPEPPSELWRSDDRGESWKCIAAFRSLHALLLTHAGTLYAIADGAILVSTDRGLTWADITYNERGWPYGLEEDGTTPGQIIVSANVGQGGMSWLGPDPSRHWTLGYDYWHTETTPESFMGRAASSTSSLAVAPATLQSYFAGEYRNSVSPPAYTTVPEHDQYRFIVGQTMRVGFEVRMLGGDEPIKLVDFDDPSACWSLVLLPLDSHKKSQNRPTHAVDRDQSREVMVDSSHPYRREIDLREIESSPNHPGKYRAKLIYRSEGLANTSRGEWPGMFEGADFGIEIVAR